MSFPLPEGVTASFSNVQAGANTGTFSFPGGAPLTVTFRPKDRNSYCVLTMYDSGGNAVLTAKQIGYYPFTVPVGGGTYYFSCTADIAIVAATATAGLR